MEVFWTQQVTSNIKGKIEIDLPNKIHKVTSYERKRLKTDENEQKCKKTMNNKERKKKMNNKNEKKTKEKEKNKNKNMPLGFHI